MFCLYFAWMLYLSPPLSRLLRFGLFAFACATLWPQSIDGLERARERYQNFERFERDLRQGLSFEEVAERHQGVIHPKKEKLLEGLKIMERRGWKFLPRPSERPQSRNSEWQRSQEAATFSQSPMPFSGVQCSSRSRSTCLRNSTK
jgi:hypothetical protein